MNDGAPGLSAAGRPPQATASILLANRPAELERMRGWLHDFLAPLGLGEDLGYRIDLTLHEAACNVIDHAWDDGGEHRFIVSITARDGEVETIIEDEGRPFAPPAHPLPAAAATLAGAAPGGRGIHLIRSHCDAWDHRRTGTINRLSMVIRARSRPLPRPHSRPRGPDRRRRADAVAAERRGRPERRVNGFISAQRLFAGVPYELMEPLMPHCSRRRLAAGEVLLAPGMHNEFLFLLIGGRLQVRLEAVDSPLGFPIDPGECAGEMSIIDGKPVSAYVVAERPSTLLAVHQEVFWKRMATTPDVARNLMQVLAERMRRRNDLLLMAQAQQLRLEHLARELATAREIQASMLPRQSPLFPHHPAVDACAVMEPARDVGGDFFDAFAIDDHRVCVAVGDVSGKGVPAALFMVRAMTLLRMEVLARGVVDGVLAAINRQLVTGNRSCMFVTLFVAILDVTRGRLCYVNGGHPPPLLGGNARPAAPIPVPPGILLGVQEEAEFPVAELTLIPGDVLTLYTDGITEAENAHGEQFSDPRLRELLATSPREDASARVRQLRNAVHTFTAGAPQSDDITLLVLCYDPSATRGG